MIRRLIIAAIAAVGLSGCATIVQGSTQSMSVNTKPEDGAKCELKNSQGTWYVTTPGSVTVHKTKTDLEISCSKEGVGKGSVTAKAKFGGTTFGNVLAGGLVGVAVDAASGANFYYDTPVTIVLTPDGAPPAGEAADAAKPGDVKPEDAKAGDAKPGEAAAEPGKPGDAAAAPADAKPAEAKPEDTKPADAAAPAAPDAQPADAKPAEAKPEDTKPTDAKPEDAKPEGSDK